MDDISRSICNAYRESARSGITSAKSKADLRKLIPIDKSKRKQDIEAQKAYIETIAGLDYESIVKDSKEQNNNIPNKKIESSIIESYVNNI